MRRRDRNSVFLVERSFYKHGNRAVEERRSSVKVKNWVIMMVESVMDYGEF